MLVVLGLAGVGGGSAALARELTRKATKAEMAAALQEEVASRWRRLHAEQIFAASVGYSTSENGNLTTASRVAIAPRASCAAALDPQVAALLSRYGCVTVLRATYLDASGTLAVTVGVVVMESQSAADRAVVAANSLTPGEEVRTFALPGTVAGQFGDSQRRAFGAITSIGRYVFLYAAGYADGRISGSSTTTPSLVDLGQGILANVQTTLTPSASACAMKDIRC